MLVVVGAAAAVVRLPDGDDRGQFDALVAGPVVSDGEGGVDELDVGLGDGGGVDLGLALSAVVAEAGPGGRVLELAGGASGFVVAVGQNLALKRVHMNAAVVTLRTAELAIVDTIIHQSSREGWWPLMIISAVFLALCSCWRVLRRDWMSTLAFVVLVISW